MPELIPFAGNPLDRAANERRDEGWLSDQSRAAGNRFLPFWRLNPLTRGKDPVELGWIDGDLRDRLDFEEEPFLLGMSDGVAHFAIDVSGMSDPVATLGLEDAEFSDARRIATELAGGDAGIVAQARALFEWHGRHRFCGTCGQPTALRNGGGMRVCTSCGAEHFPAPHAVVIMVVWRGERCLLGRGKGWGPGRFSALAGFTDLGESLEEAVAREVKEEAGLEVDKVEYIASQPWPFPMSLMLGCFAHVTGEELKVDPEELAEARWFDRDEIVRAFESPADVDFGVPGRLAIAHHIIKAWMERT